MPRELIDRNTGTSILWPQKTIAFLRERKVVPLLLALILISSIAAPEFATRANLINILRQVSINGIIACGMTLVMIGCGFDISVGSTLSLAGVIAISLQQKIGVAGGMVAALIAGGLVGTVIGYILARIKADFGGTFMITMGMMMLIYGVALLYSRGYILSGSTSDFYNEIGRGFLWRVPIPVVIFIAIATFLEFILKLTRAGRTIYLMGGNAEACRLSGINIVMYRTLTHTVVGLCAAVSGILVSSRTLSASPHAGLGYEFDAITAVVLGGTSLFGGEGSIVRTAIGVLTLGVIANIMNLKGISPNSQFVVRGLTLLLFVWLDQRRRAWEN